MANIILTLIDAKNGVVTTSYTFSDEDIAKVYAAYTHYLAPKSDNPDFEPPVITPKDVVNRIYDEMLNRVAEFTYDRQLKIACESLDITPIKATGYLG